MHAETVFFFVRTHSRKKGRNSIQCAAYRAGERLVDERTGEVFDYRRKTDVVFKGIAVPMPVPYKSREQLWNASEISHSRKDARVSRDFMFYIPNELPRPARKILVAAQARWMARKFKFAVDYALHEPSALNPHAHLHATTRTVSGAGFGKICPEFGNPLFSGFHVWRCRRMWARLCNRMLRTNGLESRVDARSYKARGMDHEPLIRETQASIADRADGILSDVAEENDARRARNALRRVIAAAKVKLKELRSLLKAAELREKLSRHLHKLADTQQPPVTTRPAAESPGLRPDQMSPPVETGVYEDVAPPVRPRFEPPKPMPPGARRRRT